ncbi:MAG TPA: pyrroline-5-carboxylate reductase [Clostridiales bacterium]|nr:pyrroline-5-carboxylate reductase [Clostridiales bacterium]
MKYDAGFLGCGNMGGALARAAAHAVAPGRIALCDTDTKKAEALALEIGGTVTDAADMIRDTAVLFLAVKPQGMKAALEPLRAALAARADSLLLVTMAAGLTVADIRELSGFDGKIIRIMPNTPVGVGAGTILYALGEGVGEEDEKIFLSLLSHAGLADRIPEEKIDAAGALSGCGPAFVYLFCEALADGAVACGVPRDKAMRYAANTVLGAAKTILDTGRHPGELKDAVCSPGGTTIEGVRLLEERAFRAAATDAVIAAYEKTAKLKK